MRVAIHANYAVAERRELIILNVDEAQAARRAEGRMPGIIPPGTPLPSEDGVVNQAVLFKYHSGGVAERLNALVLKTSKG